MSEGISIRHYRPDDLPQLKQITIDSFGGVALEQMLEEKYGRWNERSWQERKGDQIKDDCTTNALIVVDHMDNTFRRHGALLHRPSAS